MKAAIREVQLLWRGCSSDIWTSCIFNPLFVHSTFFWILKVLKDGIVKTISLLSTPIYVLFGMQKYISSVILLENDKWTKISAFEILKFLVQLKKLSQVFLIILNNQTWFYSLGIFHFFLLISYEFVSKIS